jgi:hypothetical protein
VVMKLAAVGRSSVKTGMNPMIGVVAGVDANVVGVVEDAAAVVVEDDRLPDFEASACQAHTGCKRHERNCGGSLCGLVVKDRPVDSQMVGLR